MSFLLRVKVSHRNTVLSAKVRTDLVISCERLLYVFFLLYAILTGLRWMGLSWKKGDVTNQDTATFQSKSDNRWIVCSQSNSVANVVTFLIDLVTFQRLLATSFLKSN